jgi:hypothetical protein
MKEIELFLPESVDLTEITQAVESATAAEQLFISMTGTLRSHPGSVHWHIKRRGSAGTLELTFDPNKRRLWFKIQSRRDASWIEPSMQKLRAHLERSLRGTQLP